MEANAKSYSFFEGIILMFSHIDAFKPILINTDTTEDASNGNPRVTAKNFFNCVFLLVRFPTVLPFPPRSSVNSPPILSERLKMTPAMKGFERLVTPQQKIALLQLETESKLVVVRTQSRKLVERKNAEVSGLVSFMLSHHPKQC